MPKVEWTLLLAKEFGSPNWAGMYPVHPDKFQVSEVDQTTMFTELQTKGQLLSPRQACKLFHDGLYLIKKAEETPKFLQDKIPEVAHKCFKKKQWRKQFFEGMRRVCCRLAAGLGFRPNCLAEDAFIHAILSMNFELGWKRIDEHLEGLPHWQNDRDFSRIAKFGANEDVGNLLKGVETSSSVNKKSGAIDVSKIDVKMGWFRFYDSSSAHTFDHIVKMDDDETDDWSATTGSSMDSHDLSPRNRSDSVRSDISGDWSLSEAASMDLADAPTRIRSGSNPMSPKGKVAMRSGALEPLEETAVHHTKSISSADLTMAEVVAGLKIKQ